jgi:hypothetical protein
MHVNVLPSSYRSRTEPGNVLFACFEALYLNIWGQGFKIVLQILVLTEEHSVCSYVK